LVKEKMKTFCTKTFVFCGAICLVVVIGVPVASRGGGLVAAWGEPAPTLLPSGVTDIKALSASYHTLALRSDGTVLGWGSNFFGEATIPAGLPEIRAVAAGGDFSVVLTATGEVVAWGAGYAGQTNLPSGLGNVTAIAAGYHHALALLAGGTVVGWGDNSVGELSIPAGLTNVTAIACGYQHSVALMADGTVAVWGDGNTVPAGLSNVVQIAAGFGHAVALKDDGTVVAWGINNFGTSPAPVGLSNVIAVGAGINHCLALRIDGTCVAWGSDAQGQTSIPSVLTNAEAICAGYYFNLAVVPDGPIDLAAQAQNQKLPPATNVSFVASATGAFPFYCQWYFNGALLTNSLRVAGANAGSLTISNLRVSDTGNYQLIVSNAFGSVAGPVNGLAVGTPPTFYGLNPTPYLKEPFGARVILQGASVSGTSPLRYEWVFNGAPILGATSGEIVLTNVTAAQSGNYWFVATNPFGTSSNLNTALTVEDPVAVVQPQSQAVPLDGTATFSVQATGTPPLTYHWAFNGIAIPGATSNVLKLAQVAFEQAGYYDVEIDNPVGTAFSAKALLTVAPIALWGAQSETNVPVGLKTIVALAQAGGLPYLVALQSDGTLVTWGTNGPYTPMLLPPYGSDFVAVGAGNSGGNYLGAALRSDGTVVNWVVSGLQLCDICRVPAGLSNVVAISGPGLALKSDGTITAWDYEAGYATAFSNVVAFASSDSDFGPALAIAEDENVIGPLHQTNGIPAVSNVIAVAIGPYHNLALKADGTVVAWGAYYPLAAGWSNVVAIAAGTSNSLALRADGTLVSDTQGGPPPGLSNVTAITLEYASVSSGAAAIGTGSPNFTIQPHSRSISRGTTVHFHARAVGVQPMEYQWTFNGTNLPGATTGDLAITNAQPPDTGPYQAIVSNALGTVASTVAALSVPVAFSPASPDLAAALNATNLSWTTSYGVAGWFAETNATHDGISAGQSGPIGDSQQSILQTTVSGPGTLTFWWKVSSEEDFDLLSFTVDGAMPFPAISGEVNWEQETVSVAAGVHQLSWVYSKDPSVSVGQDAGWLDQVTLLPPPPVPQRLSSAAVLPNGIFVLTAATADGTPIQAGDVGRFEAQISSNLVNWVTLPGAITLTNGILLISDSARSNAPTRFYRVIEHY
jgi:alpha-tubulin suppressor-like RCC1 family protein